jgi:hypothetical protein
LVGVGLVIAAASALDAPPAADAPPKKPGRLLAKHLYSVADDFIVDVWRNGVRVPDAQRTMLAEIFGATVEKIDVEVRSGDWLVFNVVNNRLRWGGARYFAVAGMAAEREAAFVSDVDGRWSYCDDTTKVDRFLKEAAFLADNKAEAIAAPWDQGDVRMDGLTGGWRGKGIWGQSRNTWIKFRAP